MNSDVLSNPPADRHVALNMLVRGSGLIMLGMGIKVLLTFITEVLAARILLPERYGLITWGMMSLNLLCILTGLGFNTAIRRFVSIYQSEGKPELACGVINLATLVSAIGGFLGGIGLFIGAGWLATSVMGDNREALILTTLAVALPLLNLQRVMIAVFSGFKLPKYKVLVEDIMVPAGFLIVVLSAWVMGWKEFQIVCGYVLVYFLSSILAVAFVRTKTPYRNMGQVQPQYRPREILKFSWPLIFTEPLAKFTGFIDVIIIGVFAASYEVGLYRSASDLASAMTLILMSFAFLYLPIGSDFIAKGENKQWKDMNARVARWSAVMAFPLFATLFFFPEEVLVTVYGEQYIEAASSLRILAVAYYGNAMVGFTGLNLAIAGMTKTQLVVFFCGFVLNVAGNAILIPVYGIEGAAVASLLSIFAINGTCLVVLKWKFGIHPFARQYIHNLGFMLLTASVGAWSWHQFTDAVSDIISVTVFPLMCFSFIYILHALGYLIDPVDRELMRILIKRQVSTLHKQTL